MPATEQALRLEQMYGTELAALWRRIVAIITAQYANLDRDRLADSFRAFVPAAAEVIALGQQQAQTLAAAFVAQYVETETQRAFRAAPLSAEVPGTTRDGATVRAALSGSVAAVWLGFQSGLGVEEALQRGRFAVARTAGLTVSDAAEREQIHQAEQSPSARPRLSGTLRQVPVEAPQRLLGGWTWVAVGDTCPACLSQQDGRTRRWSEKGRRHPGCDCIRSPVIPGIVDRVPRQTGEEMFNDMAPEQQASIFKNAGEEKAALIREGKATLADFAATDHAEVGTVITEAPLQVVA